MAEMYCVKCCKFNPDYLSIFLWFSFDPTIWNKSHHYQFDLGVHHTPTV